MTGTADRRSRPRARAWLVQTDGRLGADRDERTLRQRRVAPTFSLYGGWAYHGFSDDVSVTGPRAGLKVLFPMAGDAMPWARAGATYNQLDGFGGTSDSNLGLELGAGIDYAVSPRVSITPAVRYESFSPDLDGEGTVSFLTLDLGIHLHF